MAVISERFELVAVNKKSPTEKRVVNAVPVPVTAAALLTKVPAPAVDVEVEIVTAALFINRNLPMVSLGARVTVAVACVDPSKTRTSLVAGALRVGFQLDEDVQSPLATFHV